MLLVRDIRLPLSQSKEEAKSAALRRLGVGARQADAEIAKISVDARRGEPKLVYTVAVRLHDASLELHLAQRDGVSVASAAPLSLPHGNTRLEHRPVVCGLGPAGLFCALLLARQGFRPIVLERGPSVDERAEAVGRFFAGGPLDENANVQFGEGGAGTFSDGKLTTRIGSPLCDFVTQTLLEHGAPLEIAWQAKPHIGTDRLRAVIRNIRGEIEHLGGEVHFNTALTGISLRAGRLHGVKTVSGELACEILVLAIGHSARDTFQMLSDTGFSLRAKPFSIGFRAEHLQSRIDEALYHGAAGHPALPKGEYQLSHHVGNRCVYTFCMCPGGQVVAAASEAGGTVTNGMSTHARDGKNANAAVVVSVSEADFGGDALRAVAFQRELERRAFAAGNGMCAPAETVRSFLDGAGTLQLHGLEPTYPRGVCAANLGRMLPPELAGALREGLGAFERKLRGYTAPEAVLTGLETRTSSPVRIPRSETCESDFAFGVYPCGEGAGYAGGIVSAAVDGIRVAQSILAVYTPV